MYQKLKGTKDIFGLESQIYQYIRDAFTDIAKKYNYSYIETPIIESTELFVRSSGEFSDIVNKEMYTFESKSGKLISLRPEGTACAIRAYVENKLFANNYEKLFYYGTMYRYERPQKGRYREFRQGGIENLAPSSPEVNFEIIKMAYDFLKSINLKDFVLEINSLGNNDTRKKYTDELKRYFSNYTDKLSEINKLRLDNNVLRILDDKEQNDEEFVRQCPKIWDFLTKKEVDDFNRLIDLLHAYKIPYTINKNLVRGLDYYKELVFEFVSTSKALGAKSTILAGGRYDGMVEDFGGPKLDSIGFAFGVERIVEVIQSNIQNYDFDESLDIFICYLNENEKDEIINIANKLRSDFSVEIPYEILNIKKMFKRTDKLKPKMLIFKELNQPKNNIKVKLLAQNKELELKFTTTKNFIKTIKEAK